MPTDQPSLRHPPKVILECVTLTIKTITPHKHEFLISILRPHVKRTGVVVCVCNTSVETVDSWGLIVSQTSVVIKRQKDPVSENKGNGALWMI